MYLFQYSRLKSRFGSNILFLHIWTVILMYYVYGNKIIVIVIVKIPVGEKSIFTDDFTW